MRELRDKWAQQTVSQHLLFVRGVEIVYFEFKEVLLDIALKLKDHIDPKAATKKTILRKFLEEHFIKKLNPYIKFNIQTGKSSNAPRVWPESQKDKEIKRKQAEKRRKEEEDRKRQEAKRKQEAELERMREEDTPALDWAEIEEIRQRMLEEEEAKRAAEMEAAEDEEDEDEDEHEDDDDGGRDEDDDDEDEA